LSQGSKAKAKPIFAQSRKVAKKGVKQDSGFAFLCAFASWREIAFVFLLLILV
jgi:hypothetical protein